MFLSVNAKLRGCHPFHAIHSAKINILEEEAFKALCLAMYTVNKHSNASCIISRGHLVPEQSILHSVLGLQTRMIVYP